MRRLFTIGVVATTLAGVGAWAGTSSAQGLAPGTIKLLGKNAVLVDQASGDVYVQFSPTDPGKFLIVGPATLQADVKVNLAPGGAPAPATTLDILIGGKELKRLTVTPLGGADAWKGRADLRPAASVGFLMQIDPGPHAYEFKIGGADLGAGLLLVPQAKSKHALEANALVVPAKAPAPVAAPTAAPAIARATPAPTAPLGGSSVDSIVARGGRAADMRIDRFAHEVALLGGLQIPGDPTFKAEGMTMAEARWALGDGRTWALGLEAGALHYGGIPAADPARALPRYAVNVDATPVILHATWYAPLDGRARPYLAAGPGFVYASSTKKSATETLHESKVGPAADVALGLEVDLGATELKEGRQKVLLEARESYASLPFTSHDFKRLSSTSIVVGVAMKF